MFYITKKIVLQCSFHLSFQDLNAFFEHIIIFVIWVFANLFFNTRNLIPIILGIFICNCRCCFWFPPSCRDGVDCYKLYLKRVDFLSHIPIVSLEMYKGFPVSLSVGKFFVLCASKVLFLLKDVPLSLDFHFLFIESILFTNLQTLLFRTVHSFHSGHFLN